MNDTHVIVTTNLALSQIGGMQGVKTVAGWTSQSEFDWFIRGEAPFLPVKNKNGEDGTIYFPRENVLFVEKTGGKGLRKAKDEIKVSLAY